MAIKTNSQSRGLTTRVVSIHDGALDDDAMSHEQVVKYLTHLDIGWLRFAEGKSPTVFEIGPIADVDAARGVEKAGILRAKRQGVTFDSQARQDSIHEEFFRCGTRSIENLAGANHRFTEKNGVYRMGESVRGEVPISIQREIGDYIQRLTDGTIDVRAPEPGEIEPVDQEPRPEPLGGEAFDVPK